MGLDEAGMLEPLSAAVVGNPKSGVRLDEADMLVQAFLTWLNGGERVVIQHGTDGKSMGKKTKQKGWSDDRKVIATNRKARKDYDVEETFEAGIVLLGTEVKSLRSGHITFKDSYATVKQGELWLLNAHIDEYSHANRFNHDPERERKLLMKRREIERIGGRIRLEGYTLIPLEFYFKQSWVKVTIGLCRGKKKHDQRQDIAKRDAKRQIEQAMRRRR